MIHECSECSFVPDAGALLVFVVPKEIRDRANHKPEFVGKFTMPGWSGHSGFYVFKCPECDEVRIDYPHGYCENGRIYIRCDKCRFQIVFYPGKYRDVYEREGVVMPPTFWEELKHLWRKRNRKKLKALRKNTTAEAEAVETMGVRVVPANEDIRRVVEEDGDDLF